MGVGKKAKVFFHSSEDMTEIRDATVKLVVGASVFLGRKTIWQRYLDLYTKVYVENALRVLRDDGYLVVIQTDAYREGQVFPRNCLLPPYLMERGYELLDVKVWKRRAADFFQVPFSMVFIFRKNGGKSKRPSPKECKAYFRGIWDYPQTTGGKHNAYPADLCRLLVKAFTKKDDLIVDPFCGTGRLLGIAQKLGRRAVGYEIDLSLKERINKEIGYLPNKVEGKTPLF